jgi:DUF4097 and DUF4098 domain-containing protein YvlB
MSRLVPSPKSLIAAAALLAVVSGTATAQRRRASDVRSRIDTTFAFDRSGTVNVNASNGSITVVGWSRDQVQVRTSAGSENIRIDGSSNRMNLNISGRRGEGSIEVSVPIGVRVTASTHSGHVSVRGTRGPVDGHSDNGSVEVEDAVSRVDLSAFSGRLRASDVNGDAHFETISGEIEVQDIRGAIDANTVSGDIDLIGVTSKSVRAKTTSGDVTFDGIVDSNGRYELSSHSGDIRLRVPRDASAQLSVSTWNGTIDSQFPITLKPGQQRIGTLNAKRFTFEIGSGAARIVAETFSGDITVSANGRGANVRR